MTDIVTSDVIHLAKWHENEAVRLRKHPDADMSSTHGLAEMHGETASVLYMLLADRNAAKLQAAETVVALNNRDRERMQAEREARAAEAERDAAIMDADMQAREAGNMEHNARVLMAERDVLRVALMPFALAAPLDLTPEMDDQYVDSSSDMFYDLTYGYFRKARIALGKDRR
jgi:hypothetical protein